MDTEIENLVKSCSVCQESRPSPPAAPLHSWEWPSEPWSRQHLDFAVPFLGHMFLVIVDAHSKWLDVHLMSSISSAATIEKLRIVFATHGLPRKVVTDNGPSFTSAEFREFMSYNGITHVTTAPYHPSSNGLAERAVQTFKLGVKRTEGKSVQERLSNFLLTYRITPHTSTGVSPAQLLMKRRLRSRFDRLFPNMELHAQKQQANQAHHHDNAKSLRLFSVGDHVYTKDFSSTHTTWVAGTITKVTGPLSYHVQLADGRSVRRHVDAIRKGHNPLDPLRHSDLYLPDSPRTPVPPSVSAPPPLLRRSTRNCPPPVRFSYDRGH